MALLALVCLAAVLAEHYLDTAFRNSVKPSFHIKSHPLKDASKRLS